MEHKADKGQRNPRVQCAACGRWSRLHLSDGSQFMYGGCQATHGDHNAAGSDNDACDSCCKAKCKAGA